VCTLPFPPLFRLLLPVAGRSFACPDPRPWSLMSWRGLDLNDRLARAALPKRTKAGVFSFHFVCFFDYVPRNLHSLSLSSQLVQGAFAFFPRAIVRALRV